MTDEDTTQNDVAPDEGGTPTDRRPLGYWLRAVDGLITREFAAALADEGVTRRDWMLLNALSGDVDAPDLADRLARRGKRLRGLAERGWAVEIDGRWTLTDEGRAARTRLGDLVQSVRAKVAGAVSPDAFATTTASLEAIARELGWDESARPPRGRRGHGPRFGAGFRPGFGPVPFGPGGRFDAFDDEHAAWIDAAARHGFGVRHGFGPERGFGGRDGFAPEHECGHPHGDRHPHPHGRRRPHHGRHGHGEGGDGRGKDGVRAERAYERGFEAGFRAANRSADDRGTAASDSAA